MIRTKIIATMGPACATPATLLELFRAGVDICRLNFSHGDLPAHLLMLRNIREAAASHDQPIAVLGDLCGPKIRLGLITNHASTGGMPIAPGDELILQREPIPGADLRASTIYPHFVDDVQVGQRIFIEDGMLRFICTDKSANEVHCRCTMGGIIKSSKGINLPDTAVTVPSITDRDWECVAWAIENGLDYLALSFVRSAQDLQTLRDHLRQNDADIQLIAKIEKSEAIEQIEPIIAACDGLMIARGDLGVEMDAALVPILQKDLVRRCQAAGKPVIVATQMLQSMIEQASPTRAEVSDVANAIFDGADAVMLSGETSVGKFPVITVYTMNHIAEVTEQYLTTQPVPLHQTLNPASPALKMSAAVAHGVWQVVQDLKVKLVVIWSQTGQTARMFSKSRFPIPVIALSSEHRALRRMALHYGVVPHEMATPATMHELVTAVDELVLQHAYASHGDSIVIVAGASLGTPGAMNAVLIHTVSQPTPQNPAHPGFSRLTLDDAIS